MLGKICELTLYMQDSWNSYFMYYSAISHTEMKLCASLVAKTKEVLNHYLVLFHLGTCYFETLQFLALQCSTDVMKSFDLLEV